MGHCIEYYCFIRVLEEFYKDPGMKNQRVFKGALQGEKERRKERRKGRFSDQGYFFFRTRLLSLARLSKFHKEDGVC